MPDTTGPTTTHPLDTGGHGVTPIDDVCITLDGEQHTEWVVNETPEIENFGSTAAYALACRPAPAVPVETVGVQAATLPMTGGTELVGASIAGSLLLLGVGLTRLARR